MSETGKRTPKKADLNCRSALFLCGIPRAPKKADLNCRCAFLYWESHRLDKSFITDRWHSVWVPVRTTMTTMVMSMAWAWHWSCGHGHGLAWNYERLGMAFIV